MPRAFPLVKINVQFFHIIINEMKYLSFVVLMFALVLGCVESKKEQDGQQEREGFYAPDSIHWIDQGWTDEERDYWHHLNAGQEFAPLSWLKALMVPDTDISILDPNYLRSLGFLDKSVTKHNPEGLPIGFSIRPAEQDGRTMVGLTCASCHTGQLNYKGQAIRLDGGSAGFNIYQFFKDYNIALAKTLEDSVSWKQFAGRVLEIEPGDEAKLRKEVENLMEIAMWEQEAFSKLNIKSVEAGHGRMDPFNRIGNQVFGLGLREQGNYRPEDAPVGSPYLWDIGRFDWVHYNASFSQPVARNILQVLGNGGRTFFLDNDGNVKTGPEKWASNFNIERLIEMEEGYASLRAPEWPEKVLGKANKQIAEKGRALFMENCASCHAPRPILGSDPKNPEWAVTTVPVSVIGTDSSEAISFTRGQFQVSKLLGKDTPLTDGATGLQLVTDEMAKYAFDQLGWTTEQREKAYAGRPNIVRAQGIYKARPLDGVWSTPPFLHNGSVPNIYELLSPPAERSVTFWLGTFEYDPVKLGYINQQNSKSTQFDTRLPGNANSGHAFTDDAKTPGKIGRLLSHDERMAIIEYLKILPNMPPDPNAPVERSWK